VEAALRRALRLDSQAHELEDVQAFLRLVGAFFESMIEAGIDIINPVQCSAKGMEPRALKEKYKGRLVFWAAGRYPANAAVRDARRGASRGPRALRDLSQAVASCFNAIHNVQANTPVENMVAMFEAVKEFNGRGDRRGASAQCRSRRRDGDSRGVGKRQEGIVACAPAGKGNSRKRSSAMTAPAAGADRSDGDGALRVATRRRARRW